MENDLYCSSGRRGLNRTRSSRRNATRLVLMRRVERKSCHRNNGSAKHPDEDTDSLKRLGTRGHRDEVTRLHSSRILGMVGPRNDTIHVRFEASLRLDVMHHPSRRLHHFRNEIRLPHTPWGISLPSPHRGWSFQRQCPLLGQTQLLLCAVFYKIADCHHNSSI